MDSPGFSAAYCTYTVMENDSKEIIYMHTEEKRKRGRNSVIMEKEAFIISLDSLLNDLKNLKEVCTDAHPQISVLFSKYTLLRKSFSIFQFRGITRAL